jgi:hypothetical protein
MQNGKKLICKVVTDSVNCTQVHKGKSMLGVSYSGIMDARNEQGLLHCQHDF